MSFSGPCWNLRVIFQGEAVPEMASWSVEVITNRKLEPHTRVLFSMIPREAENNSELKGEHFWEDVKKRLTRKAGLNNMPFGAVTAYIRDARRNPDNIVALLYTY